MQTEVMQEGIMQEGIMQEGIMQGKRGISSAVLKNIAVVTMLIDHIGAAWPAPTKR